jgi:hypothetical protein
MDKRRKKSSVKGDLNLPAPPPHTLFIGEMTEKLPWKKA